MKVLVAPDKFKGTLTAADAAAAMAAGVRDALPHAEVDECPIADGGEGTAAILTRAAGGRIVTRRVTGPRPELRVDAAFGLSPDGATAFIEMAAAAGLALLSGAQRDPTATTTFGVGELVRFAVEAECRRVVLCLGGSATVDGGVGCAQACGRAVTTDGGPVGLSEPPLCGRDVGRVLAVETGGGRIDGVDLVLAADVDNPLLGPNGAARVFGPQKGATAAQVDHLEAALRRLAERTGTLEVAGRPAAGAAGGLGFGAMAFLGATARRGIDLVLAAVDFHARLAGADLCLTGEGRFDAGSLGGKSTVGVARACRDACVPCVVVAGSVAEEDFLRERAAAEGVAAFRALDGATLRAATAAACGFAK